MFHLTELRRQLVDITNHAPKPSEYQKTNKPHVVEKLRQFIPAPGVHLPIPNEGEEEYQSDYLNYMMNYQMRTGNHVNVISEQKRGLIVDYAFSVFTQRNRPLESFFLAVYIIDNTMQNHKKIFVTAQDKDIAPIIIAAVEIGSKCESQFGIAHHFQEQYDIRAIRLWEREHLCAFAFNTNRTHVLHFLRILQCMTNGIMRREHLDYAWATMKALGCLAMAKFTVAIQLPSLLAAALMRIALELFYMRGQLVSPMNDSLLRHLQHNESEHVPVALDFLRWLQQRPSKIVASIASYFAKQGVGFDIHELNKLIGVFEQIEFR